MITVAGPAGGRECHESAAAGRSLPVQGNSPAVDNESMPTPDDLRRGLLLTLALGAVSRPLAAADGHEWRRWPADKPVRPIDLARLDGSRWQLAAQRGRPVAANFWASWCGPCRDEMPSFARLAERHADKGLVTVTINYRESAATATRFMRALGLELPVLLDTDGDAAAAYTPRIFPSTVLFDRRGRPTGLVVGDLDWTSAVADRYLSELFAAA